MEILIQRASLGPNYRPCTEAVEKTFINFNDAPDRRFVMEIKSMDDIFFIMKKYSDVIIRHVDDYLIELGYPEYKIIIYDDYIE